MEETDAQPRWLHRVGHEAVSAVLFIPLVVASGMAVPALPWWAVWVDRLEWARARRAGAELPAEVPVRQMRAVALLGTILASHLAAFVLVFMLGSIALSLVLAPGVVAVLGQGSFAVLGWQPGKGGSWLLVPLGVGLAVVVLGGLARLGTLRFQTMAELADQETLRLAGRVRELAASRASLMDAFETERRRIERDLHDGAQQRLVGLAMGLGVTTQQVRQLAGDDERMTAVATQLEAAQDQVEQTLADLRRTVRGIHPQVLADHGLFAAVSELAGQGGLTVTVRTEGDDALISSPVAAGCYFAVAEALTNAAKHAGADAAVVTLQVRGERLRVEIVDEGRGGADVEREGASGLRGLADRLHALGGRLAVVSPAGVGTRVAIDLPLVPAWTEEG